VQITKVYENGSQGLAFCLHSSLLCAAFIRVSSDVPRSVYSLFSAESCTKMRRQQRNANAIAAIKLELTDDLPSQSVGRCTTSSLGWY